MLDVRPYTVRPAAFRPYDPRYPGVAAAVVSGIGATDAGFGLEHVGSTAVPGCGGKGNIDLLLTYQKGELTNAVNFLNARDIPRWAHPSAHPASRPVHVADVAHDNTWWPIHVHVIEAAEPEVGQLRHFRDLLRSDAAAVARYEARKRAIIGQGITFGPDYAAQKSAFIAETLQLQPE